jgi:UDP-N-acetylmuramoylalanine--D-glutamate ligase
MHDLQDKQVLVVGFGRQGQALARWLPAQGASVIVTDDKNASQLNIRRRDYPDVKFVLGRHPKSLLRGTDLICVSGGVPLSIPLLKYANRAGIPLTNDAQLFMERCPAPVIGITGSAGKTTTTTLVGEIVRASGATTWVGGNIGDVLLDDLENIGERDVVVMELSSFQLELMNISPQVGAILNITPNHLDRHKTMERYIAAKSSIIRHQTADNIAVLSADDAVTSTLDPLVQGELVTFSAQKMVPNGAFSVGNRLVLAGAASFDYVPHVLCEKDEIPLRGAHNVSNVLAACAIAGALGLAAKRPGISPETMHEAIVNFKPVPHRLEDVREVNGVTYINDSIATAPERLVAALRSFDEPLVLLLGGADKDLPWEEAVHLALQKAHHIVVFGQRGEKQVRTKAGKILRLMGAGSKTVTEVDTLEEAVTTAAERAQPGDVVLLSPGGTSYDAYDNFAERGDHFRDLVHALPEAVD